MPTWTVGFTHIWLIATSEVLGSRNGFHVCRIYTCSVTAKVINLQPLWYRSDHYLVGISMREYSTHLAIRVFASVVGAIAASLLSRSPFPTPGASLYPNLRSKPLGQLFNHQPNVGTPIFPLTMT